MTQENKELLLKDLSARLPYGVIMNTPNGDGHLCSINQTIFGNEYGINIKPTRRYYFNDEKINFKPYLRPMSSMTAEEKKEYKLLCDYYMYDKEEKHYFNNIATIDWYHQKHFDCRGLIKLGLALEATEGMYK